MPVVGVVGPESRLAAAATRNGRIGLLATPATVASGAYARALADAAPAAELHAVASAELAPLIQAGGEVDGRVVACVEGLCRPLRDAAVDTVILGCTHYPLIGPVLQRELGRGVTIVSSGEAIAAEVERRLLEAGLEADERRRGSYRFLASGDPDEFRRLGIRFLQLPIDGVEQVQVRAPSREPGGRRERRAPRRRARARRPAGGRDPARVRPHRHRLGADRGRRDARDLHGHGGERGSALDGREGAGLGHGRVRDAARVDRGAEAT